MAHRKRKKKKSTLLEPGMSDHPDRVQLYGDVGFPSKLDGEDRDEINEIGYQVKSRTVNRENFNS